MNYFQFYGIPESFQPDADLVKRKFYELSKLYHPDFYISEAAEKQQEILELSTLNNKAYQVLSNPHKTTEYILDQHDLLAEGGKYQLPQSFLVEMMEVNEALMELEFEPDPVALANTTKQIDRIEEGLKAKLAELTSSFDDKIIEERESLLSEIKDIYYRQKYLLRIRDSLNKFASR